MSESSIFLDHHLAQTTMFPFGLEIERAEGIYLFDNAGKVYMDFVSGVGVSNIGHGNQHVINAIKSQLDKHMHAMVYGEYLHTSQKRAASLLTSFLPSGLDTCYFVNSGTEAIEAALKLAKRVTGKTRIVACKGAYHGNTHGSMSVSWNETKKGAFRPLLPDIYFMGFNDSDDLSMITHDTACVIMETIQGDAGIRIPDKEYLALLRERCDETGAILILDEIQCGMGRSGTMFAFEQFNITPDILVLGKALGGGMPVGCFVSSRKNMQMLTHDPMLGHISTFAGHPVICAAVAATLDVYRAGSFLNEVESKGNWMSTELRKHPLVSEVRQRGLFFAIDLDSPERVQKVVNKCLEDGLIGFWFLSCPSSFRIAPPLVTTMEEMERASAIIWSALESA